MNLEGIWSNYEQLGAGLALGRQCVRPALFLRGERSNYLREADEPAIRGAFSQCGIPDSARSEPLAARGSPRRLPPCSTRVFRDSGLTLFSGLYIFQTQFSSLRDDKNVMQYGQIEG